MMSLKLASINLESIFDYLVPIGIMILYFVLTSGKKGKKPQEPQREEVEQPLPRRVSRPPTPTKPRQEADYTTSKDRKMITSIETKDYFSTIGEQRALSSLTEIQQTDSSDLHITLKKVPRAKKLLTNKTTLRQAFLLKEILNRPYE